MLKKYFTVIAVFLTVFLLSIWWPYVEYFWVDAPKPFTDGQLAKMRVSPADHELDRVLESGQWLPKLSGRITIADGDIIYPHNKTDFSEESVSYPFDPVDLLKGNSSWQLSLYSLSAVPLMLKNFQLTGDQKYLHMAVDYTLAFSRYDLDEKYNAGFLNNDHAVAARVYVLATLWRHYRTAEGYEAELGRDIVKYAQFLGNRLKKKSFYTYKTNHGSMQNVALMLLATVFSNVPDAQKLGDLGLYRLEEQIGYLMSSEGFFLEHSFGYHKFFISVLVAAQNYFTVNDHLSSSVIDSALKKAQNLSSGFIRDDGSIAVVGDTSSILRPYRKRLVEPDKNNIGVKTFAESGFSFLRSQNIPGCENKESFLTVFWSNFLKHGHKHWDDGTVDSYMCGTQWWRAVGYVPYWHPFREEAERWGGANAPHLIDEASPQPNGVKTIWQVNNKHLQYLRLQRVLNNKSTIDREVYQLGPVVVVADFYSSERPEELQVFWTMSADKSLIKSELEHQFVFEDSRQKFRFYSFFSSSREFSVNPARAEQESILGWVEVNHRLLPTTTLVVNGSPSTASGLLKTSVISRDKNCRPDVATELGSEINEKLVVRVANCGLDYVITRMNGDISIAVGDQVINYEINKLDDDFLSRIARVEQNTIDSIEKYKTRFKPLYTYRLKVSVLGGGVFLFCILGYWLIVKLKVQTLLLGARLSSYLLWCFLLVWVHFFYFYV